MSISKYFCGLVSENKYAQVTHLEIIPVGIIIEGQFQQTGQMRNLYTSKTIERRFLFEGVPATLSLPESASVIDIDGKSYTVSFVESVVDGSSGTAVLEKESNQVSINKFSPHLRSIEVVHKTSTHYLNNKQII